jgi:hypothetical protein
MNITLSEYELKKADEFKQRWKGLKYDIGRPDTFSYIFTPGAIGTKIEIRFNPGGHVKDITDYDLW